MPLQKKCFLIIVYIYAIVPKVLEESEDFFLFWDTLMLTHDFSSHPRKAEQQPSSPPPCTADLAQSDTDSQHKPS